MKNTIGNIKEEVEVCKNEFMFKKQGHHREISNENMQAHEMT